ncbi:MAG: hypothetical protein ACRDF6_11780, partial [bacterium]
LEAAFILERARELAADVFRRVLADGFQAFRTVTVTVRFANFVTTSRSRTVSRPLTTPEALDREVLRLFLPFLDARENPKRKAIRLIGVRAEKLLREHEAHGVQGLMCFQKGPMTGPKIATGAAARRRRCTHADQKGLEGGDTRRPGTLPPCTPDRAPDTA